MLNVEPIEDTPPVDKTEEYIADLEQEIDNLKKVQRTLKKEIKTLKNKKPDDINCCQAYKILQKNFHKLLDDIIPF